MPATYPATPDANDDFFLPAKITRKAVQIGELVFSGDTKHYIAEHGVTLVPGGDKAINQLTVTFLVGQVDIEDDALKQVEVRP